MIGRVLRRTIAVAALTTALGAGAYAVLDLGMQRASRADELVGRALRALDETRSIGAVMRVDGRTLVASCRSVHVDRSVVNLDDGTRLLIARTRVSRLRTDRQRELLAPEPVDLAAAEANLSGSHDLYSRELTATLFAGRVEVARTRFAARAAYALRLGDGRPLVELMVDRVTLRPLGARYVSRTSSGTSRIVPEPAPRRHRPTGC